MKILSFLVTAVALLAFGVLALAGQRAGGSVQISQKYHYAIGTLGAARNSTDLWQKLGCSITAVPGQPALVGCSAIDADGNRAACGSSDPELVKVVAGLNSDSEIVFYFNDENADCDELSVLTDSSAEPKAP